MSYHAVIFTSDGKIHEVDDMELAMEIVDQYGPEVVSFDETNETNDNPPPKMLEPTDETQLDIGTCQTCGCYHEFGRVQVCPCGGEVM